jgi:SulP family sulfate permease
MNAVAHRHWMQMWTRNPRIDFLSGVVVAFALIPEAIGFSVVAGVAPETGLYASVVIATVIAFTGGRVAMISAATASTAVLMGPLVHAHGVQYLFAATILMGLLQLAAGLFKLGRLMRFVSQSVMTGFVNALAILIFLAQLPQLVHVPMVTYPLIALGLAVIYLLPRLAPAITKFVPAPLIAIAAVTIAAKLLHLQVRTIAALGKLPSALPHFAVPHVPWRWETLQIIFPVSLALAAVGLLESLLTAQILDDKTDTPSDKNRECAGQGVANVASAFFGGMGGCAMIGQSIINVSSGGRGRLSTLVAGLFLLLLLVSLQPLLAIVPVAGLTAVMIMVSINTFSWPSLAQLRSNPPASSLVMLATVVTVVATSDLAKGVVVGVLLSGIFFAGKVSRLSRVTSALSADGQVRTYRVEGQIFFASAGTFFDAIDLQEALAGIVIDVSAAHFWDISAVGALDRIVLKARHRGLAVEIMGLNDASETIVERLARHRRGDDASPGPAR